ncbi:hypothetical protein [Streptomyces sp. CA-106131]|uniref:hypothetical protein n=1 Tax=Streptomyces sp. CA-106131 TaxID=3240045 RepID=UPI003D8D3892
MCGDRYQEPFCLRAEHVTVDDVMLKLNKKSGARYQFEFGRSGGRTLDLSLDVDSEDQDVVEAASGHGEATLYWWRDSLRLLKVSAGGHERTIRAAHYPGWEFTPPAAFGAVLAGLGVAALWAGLWRIVRGGASRLAVADDGAGGDLHPGRAGWGPGRAVRDALTLSPHGGVDRRCRGCGGRGAACRRWSG